MERIGGLPYWTLRIDAQGDVDGAALRALSEGVGTEQITDLVMMSHGWNNDAARADRFYRRFFRHFADVLRARRRHDARVGLVGVVWPSMRWPDEPIPDFEAADAGGGGAAGVRDLADGGGAAALTVGDGFPPPPPPTDDLVDALADAFPNSEREQVAELVRLLQERPDDPAELDRAKEIIDTLAAGAALPGGADDGEEAPAVPELAQPSRSAEDVFTAFATALEDDGVVVEGAGGAAGLGDFTKRLWNGAQEAARQLTYWRMKQRAGVVGRKGLGPAIDSLGAEHPQLRVGLVGHSFGARVVSYALAGMASAAPGRVTSITLLQGAFSHYAFAARLPHDVGRSGALAGRQQQVAGPVVACYSAHDSAVGRFYPLASKLSGEDSAGLGGADSRWGGIGANGHQPARTVTAERVQAVGDAYAFAPGSLANVDCARVVRRGGPPSGAHSDILHPELAWVVASASGLVE